MGSWKNSGIASAVTIGFVVLTFLTNPGQQGYQQYADATLKAHLKEKVCLQVAEELGTWLEDQCRIIVDTASPHLAQIINQQTKRQNFLLFSIYQTDIPLASPLPDYHLETLGILGHFYTYQADKL